MWVFTTDGFFSVVQHKDRSAYVMVKARNRAHLERLLTWVADNTDFMEDAYPGIWEDEDFDFIVRTTITKHDWAEYLNQRTDELNYTGNVKGAVMEATDPELGNVMFDIWELMVAYQREIHPGSARDLQGLDYLG